MNRSNRSAIVCCTAWSLVLLALVAGCGKSQSKPATADLQPFQKAIGEYLERSNMAMAVKEVKEGPVIHEKTATVKASLTHATMGGPAVTWEFALERDSQGAWKVIRHKP